ncbi:MAG: glycosyltransferase [Candidatus Atribacteria bacterium]|nr:glycosyltransferase [Candidatus Atribacteria bacterium]
MLQSIIAISNFSEVDIIAPEGSILNNNRSNIKILYTYQWNNINIFKKIKNLIFYGRIRFLDFNDIKKTIEWGRYDFTFFEFPWNYLLMKEAKKRNIPVFCRFHNAESQILIEQVLRERKLGYFLMLLRCPIAEKKAISISDGLIFLKKEDELFYEYKYKYIKDKACVIPISIMNRKRMTVSNVNKTIIFPAQLGYGPNKEGMLWLLDSAWDRIAKMGFTLLVAGGNADSYLKDILERKPNIKAFYDPTENDIEILYGKASFLIAPIFWGSGMKVKVAESIARGIIPIGTPEAFSGYEIEDKVNCFVFRNAEELINIFEIIDKMNNNEIANLSKSAYDLFERKYNMNISIEKYRNFIYKIIEMREKYN